MKRLLSILIVLVVFAGFASAQNITVIGTVTDSNGETLPGVNILIEGTSTGAITNMEGFYTLESGPEATLVFSFIGMTTVKEPVNGRTVINVTLSDDSHELEDIMVVAYGTTTKEAYTGAAEVVDNEIIENRPVTSFEKALQGTTAGLMVSSSSGQPGTSATVRIRGIGSLSANSSPLYVIDNVPMANALNDINPNDIESITVLKDAAAASLYGSRAANGVIIITTKNGSAGETRISFNAQVGVASRISDGYNLMNSTEFYQHSWQGLYNAALLDGKTTAEAKIYAHDNVEDIVGFNPFGVDDPLDNDGILKPGTKVITNTNWRDEVYKTGIIQNYNLNVSGGNDATKVYFSLGYLNDNGTTLSSDYTRYTAKVNVSHKVNSFITAGINNHLAYSETNAPPGGTQGANPVRSAEIINAASPVYNNDGSYNWENTASFDFNPVGLAELDLYEYKGKRAMTNAFINFDILPSLKFRTTGAIDYGSDKGVNYYNPFHGNGAGVNGRSSMSNTENLAWNISNILTWSRTKNESNIEVLAGQEAHGESYSVLSAGVTDFSIAGYPDLDWGAKPETPGSYTSEWNMISYLSQVKYNYGGRYYLSGSLREDGSSRFGKNNKYGLFYSLGASWRLSEESWMQQVNWLDNLKLRGSYGTSGNNNLGNYASLGLYGSGANYGGFPGLRPVQLANSDLSWEKISSLDIALESRFFNRLDANLDFYIKESDGLLFSKPLSAGTGFGSILTNLGAMKNTGFEATVSYDAVKRTNFKYTVGLNISTNKNTILSLTTDKIVSGTKLMEEGASIYQFYMIEWAGVNPDNGKPMWFVNAESDDDESSDIPDSAYDDPLETGRKVTSEYADAERVRLGTSLPDYFGGLTNNLEYKNFDLNFYFYFSVGGRVYNNDYATNMHDGTQPGANLSTDALNAWTPDNRYTDVPRYVTNSTDQGRQLSSRFLEDASYLRLKNISLGYNLPENLYSRLKLQGLRVFVSGENMLTFSKFKGFDPEGALNGTTSNSIPGVKVVTMGLKLDL
ncbi:TonB-dependent receptor [Prolixibacteraceae bacterium Z1-6]|uniref:TonB-dependent receptor n=1 Tax=Draconibacterium aestuarii TaxID=2998507 RepID=A0A9X3J6S4_9BACT|nr:TonB-dependent receptor [Prolixibacteraceae bacterium Z1-6]